MSEWNINQYVKALWRRMWLIVLVTLVAVGASVVMSQFMTPTYRASTTVMTGEDNTNPQVKLDDYVLSQRLASGYAGLAKRQVILEEVVKALDLQIDWRAIQDNVLVAPVQNTSLLEIRVTDTNPRRAAAIANEIARQLILHSSTLTNEQDLQQRQGFAQSQLDALQSNIDAAQAAINQKQAALDTETSARAVTDLTDQIKALQMKVTDWRAEYEKLLGGLPTKSPSTISVVETAAPPTQPVSPNLLFNILLAGFAGLVLSSGSICLMEYLGSGKVRTLVDIGNAISGPGLGVIGRMPKRRSAGQPGVLAAAEPHSRIAEEFRVLRSNLRFAWRGSEPIVLLVTSPGIAEGKSTISANLATSFAQAGKITILVDADLRHPSLHTLLNTARGEGLGTLLADSKTFVNDPTTSRDEAKKRLREHLSALLVETSTPNLVLLPAGSGSPTNPGELLALPSTPLLLELLRTSADVVIIDSPPMLPVADTAILASCPLGVVLVAESDRTSVQALTLAREALERAQARLLGVILNRAAQGTGAYYAYDPQHQSKAKSRRPSLRSLGGA